jgi:Protein of unknown function (DUF3306)
MTIENERGEDGGFLGRWSRLKREAARGEVMPPPGPAAEPAPAPVPTGREPPVAEGEPAPEARAAPAEPPALPPIESLGEGSDYKPFMARGVPPELRRLALRKAWTSNPGIANFRGFADYDWDYNAEGYGRLLPVDDVRRLCDAVLGRVGEAEEDEAATPPAAAPDGEPAPPAPVTAAPEVVAEVAATPRPAEDPLPGNG